jgi:hypothetical protein
VFQPALVIETVTATAAQFALGLWLSDRLPGRYLRHLERSSDVSFGVYLAHPLLIGGVLDVAVAAGIWHRLAGLPSGLGEALVAFAFVPFIYGVTFLAVAVVRRTFASMPLTGRRRLRPTKPPARAPEPPDVLRCRPDPGAARAASPAPRSSGPTFAPPRSRASRR